MSGKKKIGKHGLTTNIELMQMANKLGFNVTVLSKDQLAQVSSQFSKRTPSSRNFIINLQDSDKGGGTHWVALKLYDDIAFYFDSFGFMPPLEVIYFVNPRGKKIRDLYISEKHIQNQHGAYCGQYSINFLKFMQANARASKKKNQLLKLFDEFLDQWTDRSG